MTLTLRDLAFVGGGAPAVPWTPAQLGATLRVWLDADDASTITLNGSTVSQWRDKSGGGINFSNATAATQPIYAPNALNGRPALQHRGPTGTAQFGLARSGSFFFNGTGATVAGFFSAINNTNNDGAIALFQTTPARIQWGTRFGFIPQRVNYLPGGTINDGVSPIFEHWMNSPSAVNNPGSMITTVNATGQIQTHYNGASGSVLQRTWANFTATSLALGTLQFFCLPGLLAEFVLTVDPIGTSDRQKLEGYLAHKWQGAGASNSLPSGHPFKSAAPTV